MRNRCTSKQHTANQYKHDANQHHANNKPSANQCCERPRPGREEIHQLDSLLICGCMYMFIKTMFRINVLCSSVPHTAAWPKQGMHGEIISTGTTRQILQLYWCSLIHATSFRSLCVLMFLKYELMNCHGDSDPFTDQQSEYWHV